MVHYLYYLSPLFYIQDKRALCYNSNKRGGQSRTIEGQHEGVYGKRIKCPKDNKDRMKNKGNGKYNRFYKYTRYCTAIDKIYRIHVDKMSKII
jgi:hypothetical protein